MKLARRDLAYRTRRLRARPSLDDDEVRIGVSSTDDAEVKLVVVLALVLVVFGLVRPWMTMKSGSSWLRSAVVLVRCSRAIVFGIVLLRCDAVVRGCRCLMLSS